MTISNELMARLKACELEMLKAYVAVCDQLGLKYYLVEGTLLGTVRHKGFIPWDDDIDVGMPRADYERFLREAQVLLPEYYFVQSIYSESEYRSNFAKIRDSRTTFIESSARKNVINHGVYIDIFPLDYYPENKLKQRIVSFWNSCLSVYLDQCFTMPERIQPKWKKFRRRFLQCIMNCLYSSPVKALIARETLYKSCSKSTLITNYCSAWGKREIVPVEWYGEGTVLNFEGEVVRVPTEYGKLLTKIYGDYMTPPPPEKQIGHHYADVIDLERPYTDYIQKKT